MTTRTLDDNDVILLDTNVLGYLTHPTGGDVAENCKIWLRTLLAAGMNVALPEVADYELRRELLRADKLKGLRTLDFLRTQLIWVPMNSAMFLKSAELWAQMRKGGTPTAADNVLDVDVLLAAQALVSAKNLALNPIVATDNVGHLERMVTARKWSDLVLPTARR